jgi:DNA invertase Pin-like site-specific DNA recombinase
MSDKPVHLLAYCRVSSKIQKDTGSIETQKGSIEEYLKRNPHIKVEEADWYIDNGISGSKNDREQFIKLKRAVQADDINGVITYDISRLSRMDTKDWVDFMDILQKYHKLLYKAETGEIEDYTEPTTELTGIIEGWGAKQERIKTKDKTKAGIKRNRSKPEKGAVLDDHGEVLKLGGWGRKRPKIEWGRYDYYKTHFKPPMSNRHCCQMEDICLRWDKEHRLWKKGSCSLSTLRRAIKERNKD